MDYSEFRIADPGHAAWHNVVWELEAWARVSDFEKLRIHSDSLQGVVRVVDPSAPPHPGATPPGLLATLLPPCEPGDQTVPLHSADHQLLSGKFKGVFRQTGYEHQDSYKDEQALHSTLYSLVRIAQTMTWSKP